MASLQRSARWRRANRRAMARPHVFEIGVDDGVIEPRNDARRRRPRMFEVTGRCGRDSLRREALAQCFAHAHRRDELGLDAYCWYALRCATCIAANGWPSSANQSSTICSPARKAQVEHDAGVASQCSKRTMMFREKCSRVIRTQFEALHFAVWNRQLRDELGGAGYL